MSTRYVTFVAAGAALGGLLFGFDTSTMNSALVGIRETLHLTPAAVGFVAAIGLIGCAVGAWFAGPIATKRGRNRVMFGASMLVIVGFIGAALAGNVVVLGVVRFVTGVGVGAISAVVPGYVAEISPTRVRGRLGTFWQFAIVFGQFVALLAGYLLASWAGSEIAPLLWGGEAWRWMFAVAAMPAIVYLLVVRTLPTTPHDLIRLGDEAGARSVLERVGGDPVEEFTAIKKSVQGHRPTANLSDLRGPAFGLLPIVWVGIALAAFQQLVGISVVKTYSNAIWQAVGFSTSSSFGISMLTVGISIASTFLAILIMDRVGRRTLLAAGAVLMALSLAGLAFLFATATGSGADLSLGRTAGMGALIAINVFAIAFGVTWGPVMWLMLAELFDTHLRTTAVAVCTAVTWVTNCAMTLTFPILVNGIGLGYTYGIYAALSVLAFFFVIRILPETRGERLK